MRNGRSTPFVPLRQSASSSTDNRSDPGEDPVKAPSRWMAWIGCPISRLRSRHRHSLNSFPAIVHSALPQPRFCSCLRVATASGIRSRLLPECPQLNPESRQLHLSRCTGIHSRLPRIRREFRGDTAEFISKPRISRDEQRGERLECRRCIRPQNCGTAGTHTRPKRSTSYTGLSDTDCRALLCRLRTHASAHSTLIDFQSNPRRGKPSARIP
jgi:hypothetical protein